MIYHSLNCCIYFNLLLCTTKTSNKTLIESLPECNPGNATFASAKKRCLCLFTNEVEVSSLFPNQASCHQCWILSFAAFSLYSVGNYNNIKIAIALNVKKVNKF